jgi:hypothetical protein
VPAANDPAVFASPTALSFDLVDPGSSSVRSIELSDAGNGAGTWAVAIASQGAPQGAVVGAPATVNVPGRLDVEAAAPPGSPEGDATGFVTLTRGTDVRRIPYWFRVSVSRLAGEPHGSLSRTGTYRGQTKGKPARVASYRYPADPHGLAVRLPGPEQVFRVALARPAANFGVAVVGRVTGVRPSPRIVIGEDENRLAGNAGLPLAINPYLDSFGEPRPVAGVVRPARGLYSVVFDSPAGTRAGAFTFRFWVNDVTPPSVRLLRSPVGRGAPLLLALSDRGAGVDPRSLQATVDGKAASVSYAGGRARIELAARPGRHRLVLRVSDYQELKNMENVPQILPNTRVYRATFRVK